MLLSKNMPELRIYSPETLSFPDAKHPATMPDKETLDKIIFGELMDIVGGEVDKARELFVIVERERIRAVNYSLRDITS